MTAPDVGAIARRIAGGDRDALEELYRVFRVGMRYYICRELGPELLDDLLHDAFILTVQAIHRGWLNESDAVMGYARTIVRRTIAGQIDRIVKSRERQAPLDELLVGYAGVDTLNPEETVAEREEWALLQKALRGMPPRDREILERFYLAQETEPEIREAMSLTPTQFRLNKSRALKLLGERGRRLLEPRVGARRAA